MTFWSPKLRSLSPWKGHWEEPGTYKLHTMQYNAVCAGPKPCTTPFTGNRRSSTPKTKHNINKFNQPRGANPTHKKLKLKKHTHTHKKKTSTTINPTQQKMRCWETAVINHHYTSWSQQHSAWQNHWPRWLAMSRFWSVQSCCRLAGRSTKFQALNHL